LWSDEFDFGSDPDSSVWSLDVGGGGWGNNELQEYTTDNVKIQDGNLVITTQREEDGTITSGKIRSNEKLEFLYGTVEARIKVPDPSNGLWPCWWMLGASFPEVDWPASGSFTIMQAGSANALALGKGKTIVSSAAHWKANGQAASESKELDAPFDITADFYTYRMEWTPEFISTFIDGIPIFIKDIGSSCSECDEFQKPFFFIMNVAAGGEYNKIYNTAEITAPLPAEFIMDYIRIYDNGFTKLSGSAAPTLSPPTPTPSLMPTNTSTFVPTVQPTLASTDSPTIAPTLFETSSPTTSESTIAPTLVETTPPTTVPTRSPSSLPDLSAPKSSPSPTASPTTQPVSASMQRFAAVGITMWLRNVEPLSPTMGVQWAEATGKHLAAEIKEAIGLELVESVDVSVALVSQEPPFVSRRLERGAAWTFVRGLQEDQEITFNAVIAIQSQVDVNDVNPYITGAFDSDAKNAAYVGRLMSTGDAFDDAQVVSVAPAATVSRVQAPDDDTKSSDTNIGLIVGTVAVALVLCLGAFFVFTRWRKTRTHRPFHRLGGFPRKNGSISAIEKSSIVDESLYAITPQDNTRAPSILDESLYTDDSQSHSHTGSQKTVDADYDYEAAFRNLQASVADSQSGPSTLSSKDDTTLVNEFQVQVPAGKVGLVLETSYAGDPVVQEVKACSPMVGQVQVGDRLLSVDGEDMSMVHATTVSRIIASKADAPVRRFTFGRPREK
jgi:beta-glucanase (GH16 family)